MLHNVLSRPRCAFLFLLCFHILVAQATYYPPGADCQNYVIPVSINTQAYQWNGSVWKNNYELVDFVTVQVGRLGKTPHELYTGPNDFKASYEIAATFCTPSNTTLGKEKIVLLATHGLWFERNSWNSPYEPEKYNFVQFAIDQGYSIFFYDRIGVGQSTRINGFNAQALPQLAVLEQLTQVVRAGNYTGSVGVPSSIVYVGHAYGSFISAGVLAESPKSADAAILMTLGFGLSNSAVLEAETPRIASSQRPVEFKSYDDGYITWADIFQNINLNFKIGYYDLPTVEFVERTKTPFTWQETLTQTFLNVNATEFAGPLLLLNGEYDFTVCNGYCPGVTDEPAKSIYRSATPFESYIEKGCSHVIQFCSGAHNAYAKVFSFLGENGF